MKKTILFLFLLILSDCYYSQLLVTPNQTATNLANYLLGSGVTISNAQLTCRTGASGTFSTGATATNLGMTNGVVLSTGQVSSIPNGNGTTASTNNGGAGINQMSSITGSSSNFDGCLLEFDIVPLCSPLKIRYKFASEEYPEYEQSGVNDGFGFFISGPNPLGGNYTNSNLATVPGVGGPITIDNVNSTSNAAYYVTNTGSTIVYDGMTTMLTGSINITPCANYHLILAITDGGDEILDSGVFLERSGISCVGPTVTATSSAGGGSGGVICAGQSATLTANGASTYSWSTGSTNQSIVVTPTTTTSYTLGGSNIGVCIQSNIVLTVTVNPAPTAVAGTPKNLTCSQTNTILSGSGGGTYSWTGPGIVSGGSSATPTVSVAGTYSLIVTSSSSPFCPSVVSTVAVTANTTPPTPSASNSNSINCINTSATLTANGGGTYSWSGAGITSGATTANPVVNGAGPYTVTVTAVNGCTATASISVPQNTTVPTPSAANSNSINCISTTATLTATGGGTYSWSGIGIISGAATANPVVNGAGPYTFTVTSVNGCSATANTSVPQNTTVPTPSASNSNSINCINTTATLTATGGGTYLWSGAGIISGAATANPVVNGTGPYTATVTATNGCTATANTSVTQNTISPTVSSSAGVLNCTLTTVNVNATTVSTPVTTIWSGPGITSPPNTSTITANLPGTYQYTVTNTSNGCSRTGSQTVTQNTTNPTANAGSTQTLVCGVSSVTLSGSASPAGSIINWLGGVCGNTNSVTTTACAPGTYTLMVTHPVSGCTNSSTVSVSSSTNVPQATVNAITNSITCTNSIVAIGVTLSNTDPVSYNWAGPGISGTNNSASTTATLSGAYSVTITNTSSNCKSIFNVTVPTDVSPVNASVIPPASITCVTSTVVLNASPSGTNYSYSWAGPGTITNGNTENPTVNSSGNYVVTITNTVNGCTGNFTVNVPTNTIVPSVTLTANSLTTTCASSTVTMNASSSADPNSTYTWTASNGGTITNPNTSNPIANSGGTYDVVVTNTVNGCVSAPQTVTVTADANIPTFTLTTSSTSLTCLTTSQTVTVNTTGSDLTYNWTPLPASGATSSTPTFTAPGIYTCIITNTVNNCSTGAAQVNVTSNTIIPTISPASSLSITCTSTLVTITSISSPTTGLSYTWSGPGIVGLNSGSSIDVNVAGNYSVSITDAANGCTNTATALIGSNTTLPTLTITSTSTVISCAVSSSTLIANSNTGAINWNTPSGTSSNPVITGQAGEYVATATDATNGCVYSETITISGSTITPTADAGAITVIPCGTSSVVLNGSTTSSNVVTYDWSGPNSTSIVGSTNVQNPTVVDQGVYTLTVTNTVNGCYATATVNVTQSNVTAAFTADPTIGTSPLSVNFTDASVAASNWNWNFGDGTAPLSFTAAPQGLNNVYTTGSYTVTLIVTSGSCSDTASIIITVEDGLTLEIPNVFTPNGDNANEVFSIKSTGIKEIALQIFNRWGQKLYEFTGPSASWDGSSPSGIEVPSGTYFYFVKATGFDGKEIEKNGTVNLFR